VNRNTVNFTLLQSFGVFLGKLYRLDNGNIISLSSEYFKSGTASIITISFNALPNRLNQYQHDVAIMSGVYDASLCHQEVSCGFLGKISRTTKYFNHENNSGGAVVILDIDMPQSQEITSPTKFYEILCEIIPNFELVPCFSLGSSSSQVKGLNKKNYKMYFPTSNPQQIPEFMETLHQRLWLKGYGRIELSNDGRLLNRSIIDLNMKSPNQISYTSTPMVSEGIELIDPYFKWHKEGNEDYLDCSVLKRLDKQEKIELQNTVAESKASIEPTRVTEKKAQYEEHQKQKYIAKGFTRAEFEGRYTPVVMQHGVVDLPRTTVLFFKKKELTVDEVLKQKDELNGCTLADPMELDVGNKKAIFYSNTGQGDPCIHSYAHGGVVYVFKKEIKERYTRKDELSTEQATARLNGVIQTFFNAVYSHVNEAIKLKHQNIVIAATVGLGKSLAIFTELNRLKKKQSQSLFVHFYVPTHKLADDLIERISNQCPDLRLAIQRGRNTDNCQRFSEIQASGVVSQSINHLFCKNSAGNCQYIDQCAYMQQANNIGEVDVLILPHAYLALPQDEQERPPHLVVIDERFYTSLVGHEEFNLNKLQLILSPEAFKVLREKFDVDIDFGEMKTIAFHENYFSTVEKTLLLNGIDRLIALWEKKVKDILTDTELSFPIKMTELEGYLKNELLRGFSFSLGNTSVLEMFNKEYYQFLLKLREIINYDYPNAGGKTPMLTLMREGVLYFHHNYCQSAFSELKKSRFSSFKNKKTPMLCIDGDADSRISGRLLGEHQFIEINAARNLFITQCNSQLFSKKEMLGNRKGEKENQDRIIHLINKTADTNLNIHASKTLLVTYQKLAANQAFTSQLADSISVGYFGSIRGSDVYNGYNIIILGRNQIPSNAVIRQYIDLWGYDSNLNSHFSCHDASYLMKEGRMDTGTEYYFNDEELNNVMAQFREIESTQAIARCRDLWSKNPKQVLILSSLSLDLDINRSLSWSELSFDKEADKNKKLNKILAEMFEKNNGILIQSAALLCPDGYSDIERKSFIKRVGKIFEKDNKSYIIPMGEYDALRIKYGTKKEACAERYPKTHQYKRNHEGESDYKYEVIDALGKDIVFMWIKLKSSNRDLKLIYDTATHNERSALYWANKRFGAIEGYTPRLNDSENEIKLQVENLIK